MSIWDERKIHNHGFVRLVDVMPHPATELKGYEAVAQAARVSYAGADKKKLREDVALCHYLMRHKHTTPFEMVEFKFHCKMPIFVARQWIRHRTASVNEFSGRYSEMPCEFYVPDLEHVRYQSKVNRQGGSETASEQDALTFLRELGLAHSEAYRVYQAALGADLAKELARIMLPLSQYTEWYWKIDFHNLCHFLALRLNPHAQYEIRVYGEAMAEIVKEYDPVLWDVFEENKLGAVTLSKAQWETMLGGFHMACAQNTARAETHGVADTFSEEELPKLLQQCEAKIGARGTAELCAMSPVMQEALDHLKAKG